MTGKDHATSVIICVHTLERWKEIREAVRSAQLQCPPVREIVIVVDYNDELLSRLEYDFPDLTIIANRETPGLSGARNTGVKATKSPLLFFLDDDAVADPACVRQLCNYFSHPHVLGATSKIIPLWQVRRPAWFPDEFLWVVGCTYHGMRPGPVRNILGASMCLSREMFDAVGGFSHHLGRTRGTLPMGGEETEICIRAKRAFPLGVFLFDDKALTRHNVRGERLTWRYFTRRCYAEGISKARLANLSRSMESLTTERDFCVKVLPRAFARALGSGILKFDSGQVGCAFAIAVGLGCAMAGFVVGKLGGAKVDSEMGAVPRIDVPTGEH